MRKNFKMATNNTGTLMQRRKKNLKMGKEEILLILRGYISHPTNWGDILKDVKDKIDNLPQDVRDLYMTGIPRQLRQRMSTKLSSLLKKQPTDIQDADIRQEVITIQNNERRLQGDVQQPQPVEPLAPLPPLPERPQPEQHQQEQQQPEQQQLERQQAVRQHPERQQQAGPARDLRDEIADGLSTDDEERRPRRDRPRRRGRKRPLGELIRENHELYNKFIKKKIPKLLRQLGVSSSDESQ